MSQALWYYVSADRQRQGPVSALELRGLLDAGSISRRSLVWRQGMPQWQPMEQLANEIGFSAAGAPPAAASAPPPPAAAPRAVEPAATRVLSRDGMESAYATSVGVDPEASERFLHDRPVVYAGFLKRFAAVFVDSVIVGIVGGAIGGILGGIFGLAMMGNGFAANSGSAAVNAFSTLIGLALGLLYYGGFHSSEWQATPGKMLIGIKVARVDGDRLSPVRAGARFLATYINLFTLGIGWLMAAFTDRKQALHDFISDTVVVDRWAFTEFPERQNEALGGCAIAILIVWALLLVAMLVALGLLVSTLSSGSWR